MDKLEQAREGSANEEHFANNQWGTVLRITNQKCTRNVEKTIKTLDMALLLIKLVESFTIAIFNALIDCKFPLTHSLPQTIFSPSILKEWLAYMTAIHHCIAPK